MIQITISILTDIIDIYRKLDKNRREKMKKGDYDGQND
jgi:hypothetical protein